MFFISGFALSDFAFAEANGTPFAVDPAENGPFALPGGPGATATLAANATPVVINVADDDPTLDDAFLEAAGALSVLDQPVVIDGQTVAAGTVVEAEFFFTTDTGQQFIFVSLGGAGSNDGTLQMVVSDGPIRPGETLTFVESTDGALIPFETIVICFAEGTQIETPRGPVPVEALEAGDTVTNSDGHPVEIRWIGSRKMSAGALRRWPHLRPVEIRAGALGEGLPRRDLTVSPQHRILLSDWRAEILFGESEVLIPAKALIDDRSIKTSGIVEVTYHHILLDRHEIIRAEGVPCESFHPGETVMSAMEQPVRDELFELFPELETDHAAYGPTARHVLRGYEATAFAKLVGR